MQNITDDTPSTSAAAIKPKLKKCRDNSKQPKRVRNSARRRIFLNSTSKSSSNTQVITRKLLRSIKRRELQQNVPPAKRAGLKRRLNFAGDGSIRRRTNRLQRGRNVTLEEGEIVSDSEPENATATIRTSHEDGDDDDCIYIEPKIEQVILDDDTPCSTHTAAAPTSTRTAAVAPKSFIGNVLTSTPCPKSKDNAVSDTTTASSDTLAVPLFFKDVSQAAWFETITSEDTFTNYSKLSTLRGESSLYKRRSVRSKQQPFALYRDIVVLDEDSMDEVTMKPAAKKRKTSKISDDSVIFVSESNPNILPSFIPLIDAIVPNPMHISYTPKKQVKQANDLFSKSEQKQLNAYNDNAYNPTAGQELRTQKRMVIVDGSNVAFNHGLNQQFSIRGLQICIDYFEKMGHEVKVVLPQYRLGKNKSTDSEMLERLHKAGKIVLTPCKNLPGKSSISYDDRFVLQLACELDAAVVSNDNYRDLINENAAFKKLIEHRVVGYTWCNDIFILPKDPYGKWGPTLHTILNRM